MVGRRLGGRISKRSKPKLEPSQQALNRHTVEARMHSAIPRNDLATGTKDELALRLLRRVPVLSESVFVAPQAEPLRTTTGPAIGGAPHLFLCLN